MKIIPVFRVFDYAKTIEFYVNWLGCTIEWEYRPDNTPFYMRVALRGISFDLSEHHGDCSPGGKFIFTGFEGLTTYHRELLRKNYTYYRPGLQRVEWDKDTIEMTVTDPFSNRIIFNEVVPADQKDFNTISPSALFLLFTKSHTQIPFMSQAVQLIQDQGMAPADKGEKDLGFWLRVLHFEHRYRSIDQLLESLPVSNILELSSGYSFRGLDKVQKENVQYIDTDLEDVIEHKQQFIDAFREDLPPAKGHLHLLPLNVLDEARFETIVASFPPGPIAIVNEGLLMYLNLEEKKKLCSIIHKILKERGGYWITADIYIPSPFDNKRLVNSRHQQFLDFHKVDEQKFESFEAAKTFFREAGFEIAKTATVDVSKLTAIPQLGNEQQLNRSRATWMLEAK